MKKTLSTKEQIVRKSIIFIFFAWVLITWPKWESECRNIFHSKTKSLAIVLQYYRNILLAREQVFFVQFLLIDIKHDTVTNCCKITFYWLALVFIVVNKSSKKSCVKIWYIVYRPAKNENNRKEYLAQQLEFPKNSFSKTSRETSLFWVMLVGVSIWTHSSIF